MYNLKVSEDDLCSLICYVSRDLIEKVKVSYITKNYFLILNDDFKLLSYLLKEFGYNGNVYDYLHNVGLDDKYIIFLDEIVVDNLFK